VQKQMYQILKNRMLFQHACIYAHSPEHMPVGVRFIFLPHMSQAHGQTSTQKEDTVMRSTIDSFMLLTLFLISNNW